MSAELVKTSVKLQARLQSIPPLPWIDPRAPEPAEIDGYLQTLEAACLENSSPVDLQACQGLAYAINDDVYASMDTRARSTMFDPTHFWAQLKFAELQYRHRSLALAEKETLKAVELARHTWQLLLARRQLQEIRRLSRESAESLSWERPVTVTALQWS